MSNNWFNNNTNGWFNYFYDHKDQGQRWRNLRFRYAFPNLESFVGAFPVDLKGVAEEWYPILFAAMPNATLNWSRPEACQANLFIIVRKYGQYWKRLNEVKALSLNDVFSNDVISTFTNDANSTNNGNTDTTTSSNSNSQSTDYNTNNEFVGDRDKFDDSEWKADKYLQDGSNNNGSSNSNGNITKFNTNISHEHAQNEKKDTQYDPKQIATFIGLCADPNAWIIENVIYDMLAPVQNNYDYLEGWEGDYRGRGFE